MIVKNKGNLKMRTSKTQKTILCALAVSTLLSPTVITYAAEQEEFGFDQVVVTANRVPQTVASTPADVTVVTAQQIAEKGARNLADALEGVPGVVIAKNGGPGEMAVPYILGTDRVVVLMDGKRINIPQGIGSGSGGVNLSTILVGDNIARIEVVRGGNSVLYGADAVGGVINIVTRKGAGMAKTQVDVGGGSNSTSKIGISHQGAENGWHWYVTGTQDNTDGQRPLSDYKGKNSTFRLDKDLSKNETLSMDFDYYSSHAHTPGNTTGTWAPTIEDYLRHDWSIAYSDKHANGEKTIRFYNNQQERTSVIPSYFSQYFYKNNVRALEYQDSAKVNERNDVTWGGEWRKETVTTADYGMTPSRDRLVNAVYLQDRYKINERTSSIVGMRYDHSDQYGTNWLPKVSIIHTVDKKTSYFVNWDKVFKAPKFDDLYTPFDVRWGGGDPNLKPETGWSAETGIKKQLSKESEMTVSLFKRELNDAIKWVASGNQYNAKNIDHLTDQGATLAFATRISPVLFANASYTYIDSRDQNNRQQSPHNTFNLGLNLQQGKFTQNISGRYVDAQYTYNDFSQSFDRTSSYFVWNTTLNYSMTKDQSVYLTVTNLFDKKYQTVKDYPAQERSIFVGIKQSL